MFLRVTILLSTLLICNTQQQPIQNVTAQLALKVNQTRGEIIKSLEQNGEKLSMANLKIHPLVNEAQKKLDLKVEALYEALGSMDRGPGCVEAAEAQIDQLVVVLNAEPLNKCRQSESLTAAGDKQREIRKLISRVSGSIHSCKNQNPNNSEGLKICVENDLAASKAVLQSKNAELENILVKAQVDVVGCVNQSAGALQQQANQIESQLNHCS